MTIRPRNALGTVILFLGLGIIVAEFYFHYQGHLTGIEREVSFANVFAGAFLMFIGGAVMTPLLANDIADGVVDRLIKLLAVMPGGRRWYDKAFGTSVAPSAIPAGDSVIADVAAPVATSNAADGVRSEPRPPVPSADLSPGP